MNFFTSSPLELDLVTLKVSLVLDHLNKRLEERRLHVGMCKYVGQGMVRSSYMIPLQNWQHIKDWSI